MMKEQADELRRLEFVEDKNFGGAMYTGYVDTKGDWDGLGELDMMNGDVYEGEF